MKKYRNVSYEIWENYYIKLTYEPGIKKHGIDIYRNGTGFVTIPENMRKYPDLFAKNTIDMLYDRAQYHADHELRERLK